MENRNKYYLLLNPSRQYCIFRSCEGVNSSILSSLKGNYIKFWNQITFLAPANSGMLSDFTSTNIGGRVCSPKLKKVIEANKSDLDTLQWLPIKVKDESSGNIYDYYCLHFPCIADSLDEKATIYENFMGRKKVRYPIYSYKKIKDREIFNSPGFCESFLTVLSDKMRIAIEKEGCTGLDLDCAKVINDVEELKNAN